MSNKSTTKKDSKTQWNMAFAKAQDALSSEWKTIYGVSDLAGMTSIVRNEQKEIYPGNLSQWCLELRNRFHELCEGR